MSKYQIELSSKAKKFYEKCPKELALRLNDCFETLEKDPYRGPNIKRLKTSANEQLFRYRIGDYRVIYEVYDKEVIVLVVKIAKRADAYKQL